MPVAGQVVVYASVVCNHAGLCRRIRRNKGENIESIQDQGTFCGEQAYLYLSAYMNTAGLCVLVYIYYQLYRKNK